jgi:acetyltransferase-like isoleucine patch superfamily enzyme
MGEYHARRERERYEEQRRLQEEARKKEEELLLMRAINTGDESLLYQPVEVPTVVIEEKKVQGISYREVVRYEIVDSMKVPFPEYWVIDDMKIGKVARATNGTVVIPGVRVWKEKVVAASPNRV